MNLFEFENMDSLRTDRNRRTPTKLRDSHNPGKRK
jgi:hypothetical protein